jgi:proton glutamate symport protein
MKKGGLLTLLMLLGLAAGLLYGQYGLYSAVSPLDEQHWTRTAGEFILLRPMTMLVMPLAFIGVTVGVAMVGSPLRLGVMGASTVVYFLASALLAVSAGAFAADRWQPGAPGGPGGLPAADAQSLIDSAQSKLESSTSMATEVHAMRDRGLDTPGGAWMDLVRSAVPTNVSGEMMRGNIVGVMLLALLLGMALAAGGARTAPALAAFQALMEALLVIARWLAWLAPVGVMLLTAYAVGRVGLDSLRGPLSRFAIIVASALGFHTLIALPVIMLLLTRRNPWSFMWRVRQPLLLGVGTASSAASMPLAIHAARHDAGCSMAASGFVIPLGTAVHRSGTALFQAAAAVFLCQIHGISLQFGDFVIVAITAVLASIAAAGVPGAGIVTLIIVLSALNTSLAGRGLAQIPAHAIGIIIGLDLLLDPVRTLVNVWGNLVGARIATRLAPDSAA